MQHRIEPPVLLSRLLMFVFAGTVVVAFVMFMTLGQMFPLNRPEVFFITTKPANSVVVQVSEMPTDSANLEIYKTAFVMEYIRVRNTVEKNIAITRRKWGDASGVIASWSTPRVYAEFKETGMYRAVTNDYADFEFACHVDFPSGRPVSLGQNQYRVKVRYFCTDKNGKTDNKDYNIVVALRVADNASVPWIERLDNPLGLKVDRYYIEGGAGDPLDTGFSQ